MSRNYLWMALLCCTATAVVAQEKSTDPLEPKFPDIVVAESLMNREVIDKDGLKIGNIDEIVLDLRSGCVAFVSIHSNASAKSVGKDEKISSRQLLVVPLVISEWEKDKPLRVSMPSKDVFPSSVEMQSKSTASLDGNELALLYKHYSADVYWQSPNSNQRTPFLMTVDDLDGRLVRDAAGTKFGRIQEVLLSPGENWKIAFLALSQFKDHKNDSERIAVPLAAFVRRPSTATFLLDVPEEAKLLEQSFNVGDWPHKIDRGWVEFAHVKYGAAATDGIQEINGEKKN